MRFFFFFLATGKVPSNFEHKHTEFCLQNSLWISHMQNVCMWQLFYMRQLWEFSVSGNTSEDWVSKQYCKSIGEDPCNLKWNASTFLAYKSTCKWSLQNWWLLKVPWSKKEVVICRLQDIADTGHQKTASILSMMYFQGLYSTYTGLWNVFDSLDDTFIQQFLSNDESNTIPQMRESVLRVKKVDWQVVETHTWFWWIWNKISFGQTHIFHVKVCSQPYYRKKICYINFPSWLKNTQG